MSDHFVRALLQDRDQSAIKRPLIENHEDPPPLLSSPLYSPPSSPLSPSSPPLHPAGLNENPDGLNDSERTLLATIKADEYQAFADELKRPDGNIVSFLSIKGADKTQAIARLLARVPEGCATWKILKEFIGERSQDVVEAPDRVGVQASFAAVFSHFFDMVNENQCNAFRALGKKLAKEGLGAEFITFAQAEQLVTNAEDEFKNKFQAAAEALEDLRDFTEANLKLLDFGEDLVDFRNRAYEHYFPRDLISMLHTQMKRSRV